MRYALLAIFVVAALVLVAVQVFQHGFEQGYRSALESPTEQSAPARPVVIVASSTPTAFHGPIGQPHMVGPSFPPPNH